MKNCLCGLTLPSHSVSTWVCPRCGTCFSFAESPSPDGYFHPTLPAAVEEEVNRLFPQLGTLLNNTQEEVLDSLRREYHLEQALEDLRLLVVVGTRYAKAWGRRSRRGSFRIRERERESIATGVIMWRCGGDPKTLHNVNHVVWERVQEILNSLFPQVCHHNN